MQNLRRARLAGAGLSLAELSVPGHAYVLAGLPDGPEGIRQTLGIMRRLVKIYRADPRIRELAERIIAGVPAKAWRREAEAIHDYLRDHVRYTQDVNDVETIKTPAQLLGLDADTSLAFKGDCDDYATAGAALLESIGHPARFIVVGFVPDQFEHVYIETLIGRDWIASDPTEPVPFGWAPDGVVTKMPPFHV